MPFSVYIIYSIIRNKFYVGYTSDDIQDRLKKHNTNHEGFTGKTNDWVIKYFERYDLKAEAVKREKEIKNWKSIKKIEKLIFQARIRVLQIHNILVFLTRIRLKMTINNYKRLFLLK